MDSMFVHNLAIDSYGMVKRVVNQICAYEPDFGIIASEGILLDGETLETSRFIAPKARPEIAFIFNKKISLEKHPVKPSDIIDSTYGIAAAIEIVDSRIRDWRLHNQDTIADAASYAAFVLGNRVIPIDSVDLLLTGAQVFRNNEPIQTDYSGSIIGNPIDAMTWLANRLLSLGIELDAGGITLSGSFAPVFDIHPGDMINVCFDHFGEVSLKVV